ncbi:MAG TPA: sugar phosphate isomerase/epimerase family protein [Bacteroidota bacterium]
MKYGAHQYLFVEHWSDKELHVLDTARSLDLDMFELSVGDDIVFTPQLTRRRAETLGLDLLVGPGGVWPLECDLSSDDPAERAKGLRWHMHQVDLTAELGARAYMGSIYGHSGVVKRRRPPADEMKWTAEGLHRLAEHAASRGVMVTLEPMSHFRTHLVNTPRQLLCLLQLADHGNLKALFDTYHVVTEIRDYSEAVRMLAPRLFCVHACESDRGIPGGGLIPWEGIFETLLEVAYEGYVGLEGYNSGLDDFAYRRGMFHNVCPDGPAFVRQGIGFLREMERSCRTRRRPNAAGRGDGGQSAPRTAPRKLP